MGFNSLLIIRFLFPYTGISMRAANKMIIRPCFPKQMRAIHKRFVSSIAFALQLSFPTQKKNFGDY